MTRLFVAVDVPEDARATLDGAVAPLRERYDDLRWSRPATWHLTLAFLGEVSIGGRIRAINALRLAARTLAPCTITLSGRLGRFGHRVLWAAVDADGPGLETLADGIRGALADAGVPFDDRPFRPHLTLARGRKGQRLPRMRAVTAPGLPCSWPVTTVALMASPQNGRANGYRTVATWPLTGSAPVGGDLVGEGARERAGGWGSGG